jgi:beta-N-acetylhexosaminidase
MLRMTAIVTTVLVLVVGITTAIALGACSTGSDIPVGPPSISGRITTVTAAPGGGSLLVEAPGAEAPAYDAASVWVTPETKLFRQGADGATERIAFGDFEPGQRVDVWFEGPVAESYPVQASASTVLLTE